LKFKSISTMAKKFEEFQINTNTSIKNMTARMLLMENDIKILKAKVNISKDDESSLKHEEM
jgi:hypothetical protein